MWDEWSEEDFTRHALLGRLTESFNRAELMIHVLYWLGRAEDSDWATARAESATWPATQLAKEVRRLLKREKYRARQEGIADLLNRLLSDPERLIDRRNAYVHAWWDERVVSGSLIQVRARLRDWIPEGDSSLAEYDEHDLQRLINQIDRFTEDAVALFNK